MRGGRSKGFPSLKTSHSRTGGSPCSSPRCRRRRKCFPGAATRAPNFVPAKTADAARLPHPPIDTTSSPPVSSLERANPAPPQRGYSAGRARQCRPGDAIGQHDKYRDPRDKAPFEPAAGLYAADAPAPCGALASRSAIRGLPARPLPPRIRAGRHRPPRRAGRTAASGTSPGKVSAWHIRSYVAPRCAAIAAAGHAPRTPSRDGGPGTPRRITCKLTRLRMARDHQAINATPVLDEVARDYIRRAVPKRIAPWEVLVKDLRPARIDFPSFYAARRVAPVQRQASAAPLGKRRGTGKIAGPIRSMANGEGRRMVTTGADGFANDAKSSLFKPEELLTPSAFPHAVTRLELRQTNISFVVLTGPFAYKIKKSVNWNSSIPPPLRSGNTCAPRNCGSTGDWRPTFM